MTRRLVDRLIFELEPTPVVPIVGDKRSYPVDRIFCVGRNYADHAKEMGFEVDREAPWYFTKPASAIVLTGGTIPYPPETSNFHYEVELVVAMGAEVFRGSIDQAAKSVFGYACCLDMTRRDLQLAARERSRPWDLGKAFEKLGCYWPDYTCVTIHGDRPTTYFTERRRHHKTTRASVGPRLERARTHQPSFTLLSP
jgi:Fumarylacetoacetate (FAA) hydrolase family